MKDMLEALTHFRSSGYKIDVYIHSKKYLPLNIKVDDDGISLSDENSIICTISVIKTEEKGKIMIHLKEKQIDLIEQCKNRMTEELL